METFALPPNDGRRRPGLYHLSHAACCLLALLLLSACAGYRGPDRLQAEPALYEATPPSSPAARFAPLLLVEASQFPYNRPGSPRLARGADGAITAVVDPDRPVLFFQEERFAGRHGTYRNLIYRVHFSEVPPGHLTSGANVGLVIVVTVDDADRPVLYTTAHTCGCYLAIVPTSHLPAQALPPGWDRQTQNVYGEILPGLLTLPAAGGQGRLQLTLRSETHRVMDMRLVTGQDVGTTALSLPLLPMATLRQLPLDGRNASFFEETGASKGYVRHSGKFWERLLISWWALDSRVGEDKDLGPAAETGVIFYTSLKPWAREASDLWRFQAFLDYWGWRL
ncbi:MAG: hypothetical protein BWK76_00395 [Desulfobulbaceae bacterium A2]|nr:MAG: hypothetical protein BWK76_00395 [Desulfobulbaceae bacterium A2]